MTRKIVQKVGFAGAILLVLLIANIVMNPARFHPAAWGTLIGMAAPLIGAALASTPVILAGRGGIDISVGPVMGLVNAVVPHDDLLPRARDLLERILVHSPLAVSTILTAVTRGINLPIAEGLMVEAEQFARMAPTADLREGLDAWIARRAPAYPGLWTASAEG